tara:strand:+ start:37 stop:315 length:279 start_codon:yes stop_codon:yes gene_type:complete
VIKIEFSFAIALYLTLAVFLLLLVWMLFDKKKGLKPFTSEDRFFWQCDICTYVYVDTKHITISKCPRCESFNKREGTIKEQQHTKKGGLYAR